MAAENIKSEIKISEPVLRSDFADALKVIEETTMRNVIELDYLTDSSSGEILVAKDENKVVGMIRMFRPGKVFEQMPENHFALDQIKYGKTDIGYISIIAVNPKYQGRGIGKKLVKRALAIQKEFESKCVDVHTWQGSPGNASQKLFESLGFERIKMHKAPWREFSKKKGPKNYWCPVCGNPCVCDELEMVKYLD